MRILVTGGAGFIGSHIIDELISYSHEVDVWDNLSGGVDYTPELANVVEKLGVDAPYDVVVHAAAYASIRGSFDAPDRTWYDNLTITRELVALMPSARYVYVSTGAVYGATANQTHEDARTAPTSHYGASKLAAEAVIQFSTQNATILRLACVVGDRYHRGHIADFCAQARRESGKLLKEPIKALANSPGRSYVHVRDVCAAVRMAVHEQLAPGTYNVAAGMWSPGQTAQILKARYNIDTHFSGETFRGDVGVWMSSAKLASQGWAPRHAIPRGVEEAISHNMREVAHEVAR